MSAYSTLRITRSKARKMVLEYIAGGLSDEELKFLLDRILDGLLYNARIVADDEENDERRL